MYRKGLTLHPEAAELFGRFALFLGDELENLKEAKLYFAKALEIEPDYPGNTNAEGYLAICDGKYPEAQQKLELALLFNQNRKNDIALGVNLNLAILALLNSESQDSYLAEIASLIEGGVVCKYWTFDLLLKYISGHVQTAELTFYESVVNGVCGTLDAKDSALAIRNRIASAKKIEEIAEKSNSKKSGRKTSKRKKKEAE